MSRSSAFMVGGAALAIVVGLFLIGCRDSSEGADGFTPPPIRSVTPPRPSATATSARSTPTATAAIVAGPWTPVVGNLVGLSSECGNMSLVSVAPDRDNVIASIALRGLWASQEGSGTWTSLGNGGGSAAITNRGSSIVYDPEQPGRFWESGIYNGGGVYRTDDGGLTFRQLGDVRHVDAVSVDFTDPGRRTLLVGIHELPTVFRSSDGGANWTDVSRSLPTGLGNATGPFVIDAQTHLLGTSAGANSGVFRTTDGGKAWTQVYRGGVIGLPLLARSDGSLYWVLDRSGGIIKSTDNGLSWSPVAGGGAVSALATNLVELPDGRLAASSDKWVVISADHGVTWRAVGPAMPYVPSGFTYSQFRKAFLIWRWTCNSAAANPIAPDAIMQLGFDYKTQ